MWPYKRTWRDRLHEWSDTANDVSMALIGVILVVAFAAASGLGIYALYLGVVAR